MTKVANPKSARKTGKSKPATWVPPPGAPELTRLAAGRRTLTRGAREALTAAAAETPELPEELRLAGGRVLSVVMSALDRADVATLERMLRAVLSGRDDPEKIPGETMARVVRRVALGLRRPDGKAYSEGEGDSQAVGCVRALATLHRDFGKLDDDAETIALFRSARDRRLQPRRTTAELLTLIDGCELQLAVKRVETALRSSR
jgi:hypothetical protein